MRAEKEIPYRILGRTGERVSAIGLGGWHLGFSCLSDDDSVRLIRTAIDRGITFMDNCWDYFDGLSETRMGKALRDGYRDRVFLMTKIDGRSRKEAARQLDESLRRLGVETIDLVQHHEVIRFEDADRMFYDDGANAALLEARQASFVTSGSPVTRTPISTSTRSTSRASMGSRSTRSRCRST